MSKEKVTKSKGIKLKSNIPFHYIRGYRFKNGEIEVETEEEARALEVYNGVSRV